MDETKSTIRKQEAMIEFFQNSDPENAAWGVFFLSGNRLKRFISSRTLRKWAREFLNWPRWLFDECMVTVGDTAEGISLTIDTYKANQQKADASILPGLDALMDQLKELQSVGENQQKSQLFEWWKQLDQTGIFVINKLLTGAFRMGVHKQSTASALAEMYDLDKSTVLHRLMGNWVPTGQFYLDLISKDTTDVDKSRPYPFFLASPLMDSLSNLGNVNDWFIEWKYDGIRAQLVKRENEVFIWSRGEEIINQSFPELVEAALALPDGVVLDGEILAYYQGSPLAFSVLQRRIGRENVTSTILKEAPVILMVYDILEFDGEDMRNESLENRRIVLKESIFPVVSSEGKFQLSPLIEGKNWEEMSEKHKSSRNFQAEGFMIKRKSSTYQTGRKRGDWWKFKIDPLTLDCVLIGAQSGSGRRASLFTDYTFAVQSGSDLIRIGKAYRGLTDDEIKKLDTWIRANTVDKSGPYRTVTPEHVFEIGFDGIMSNERTKSGISWRFPRILRWREDKLVSEIDTIESARDLLQYEGITEIKFEHSLDEFF